jgi:DHA1 family bicyclomycin/chloramphenicol resistance-like MFS transporter
MQLLTVILLEILTGVEVDLFVPSLPELQHLFSVSPFMVELTLGVNLVAQCISCLIVGSLGDRYGRKPVILWGLALFILGSILCVSATYFWEILLGRALQGAGIAAAAVLAYVIIADMYCVADQQKIMGWMNAVITLSMATAPVIGCFVNLYFHWRGNFFILLVLGIIAFLMSACYLPKSEPNPQVSLSLAGYVPVLKSSTILLYMLAVCFLVIPFWVFAGIAPIYYMEGLGVSLQAYGLYQGAGLVMFAMLSLGSGAVIRYIGETRSLRFSMNGMVAFLVFSGLVIAFQINDPLATTSLMILLSLTMVMPIVVLWPRALEVLPEAKGRITALFHACRMVCTTLGIQTASYFYTGIFMPIGLVLGFMIIVGLAASYSLLQKEQQKWQNA